MDLVPQIKMIKLIVIISSILLITCVCIAGDVNYDPLSRNTGSSVYVDRDVDNDGKWDYGKGGSDRDIDNDGRWDYDKGGSDRDLDNDGITDY